MGLEVHEGPRLARTAEGALAAGNVVTVEPGVYLPGEFGVRIEDLVAVTERRPRGADRVPEGARDGRLMALAAVAAFAGALVQSATGFGFALMLSPALFAVMEPGRGGHALLVLGLALSLLVLFEGGRPEHVDWRALAPMLVAALPGLAVGAVALTQLSKEALQVAVGVAVIAAAGWQLRARGQRARPRLGGPPAWRRASRAGR